MKVKELIEALQTLKPDAEVLINIMQPNKVHGVIQLPIDGSKFGVDKNEYWNITPHYQGATISVKLPDNNFISQKKKQ